MVCVATVSLGDMLPGSPSVREVSTKPRLANDCVAAALPSDYVVITPLRWRGFSMFRTPLPRARITELLHLGCPLKPWIGTLLIVSE